MRTHLALMIGLALSGLCCHALHLAGNGKTDYTIILPEKATEMDKFVADDLAMHLNTMTGAAFAVSDKAGAKNIRLLRDNALGKQEARVAVQGQDLILAGGDKFGTAYAVYYFLEDNLGCRWYDYREAPVIPSKPELDIPELNYRKVPKFPFRYITQYIYAHPDSKKFLFRNKFNMGQVLNNPGKAPAAIEPFLHIRGTHAHSLFKYIPPKTYFATHPEFFSMLGNGKHVNDRQLCFSNPELRKEFIKNFDAYADKNGGTGYYSISAEDVGGSFCLCPACSAQEKQYKSSGGPLYDFLFELCEHVRNKYPDIMLATLAYRKNQSQKPPVLAAGKKMPDNLIIVFAPIDDSFAKSMDHPQNVETLEDLKRWKAIAEHIIIWYYPAPYGYQTNAPYSGFKRATHDIQLFDSIGCHGSLYEHNVGVTESLNFGIMHTWIFAKMFDNPQADPQALAEEYCRYRFGDAAGMVLRYLSEMDSHLENMKAFVPWNGWPQMRMSFTPTQLVKWHGLFQTMKGKVANDPKALLHVRELELTLDAEILYRWTDILKEFPQAFSFTREELYDKILKQCDENQADAAKSPFAIKYLPAFKKDLAFFNKRATVGDVPLPEQFAHYPAGRVRQFFSLEASNSMPRHIDMPDAALGTAIWNGKIQYDMPYQLGVYDNGRKTFGERVDIKKEDIVIDKFHFYKVASHSHIYENTQIWMTHQWFAGVSLRDAYVMGADDKTYEIWVSLKFVGPGYGNSKEKKDNVYLDRVIVIENTK